MVDNKTCIAIAQDINSKRKMLSIWQDINLFNKKIMKNEIE